MPKAQTVFSPRSQYGLATHLRGVGPVDSFELLFGSSTRGNSREFQSKSCYRGLVGTYAWGQQKSTSWQHSGAFQAKHLECDPDALVKWSPYIAHWLRVVKTTSKHREQEGTRRSFKSPMVKTETWPTIQHFVSIAEPHWQDSTYVIIVQKLSASETQSISLACAQQYSSCSTTNFLLLSNSQSFLP